MGLGADCVDAALEAMDQPRYKYFQMPLITTLKHGGSWPRAELRIYPDALEQIKEIAQYGYRSLSEQEWVYLEHVTRCQVMGVEWGEILGDDGVTYYGAARQGKCLLGKNHKGDHTLQLISSEGKEFDKTYSPHHRGDSNA